MKEAIKKIVEGGGCVCFFYKKKKRDFIRPARILVVDGDCYVEIPGVAYFEEFKSLDEAIDFFIENVFSKKNFAHPKKLRQTKKINPPKAPEVS